MPRNLLFVFGDEQSGFNGARAMAQHLANVLDRDGQSGQSQQRLAADVSTCEYAGRVRYASRLSQTLLTDGEGESVDVAWLVGVGDAADAPKARFTIVQELF